MGLCIRLCTCTESGGCLIPGESQHVEETFLGSLLPEESMSLQDLPAHPARLPFQGKTCPTLKSFSELPWSREGAFFVSKSSYPKRVNRGSWEGNKVRTRGDWLETAWGKQNHKTVCRTRRPGLLQSMGAIMSLTGLSNWTELREVKAGNLPMNFMLIILSSSPISFLWVVSSSAPLLVSFPGSLCNCFSTSNT